MSYIVMLGGGFIVLIGLVSLLAPARLDTILDKGKSPGGLWFGALFRIILGGALFFSAPETNNPDFIQGLGIVFVLAGLLVPVIGLKRATRLLNWFQGLGHGAHRIWGIVAILFGAWIVSVVL